MCDESLQILPVTVLQSYRGWFLIFLSSVSFGYRQEWCIHEDPCDRRKLPSTHPHFSETSAELY